MSKSTLKDNLVNIIRNEIENGVYEVNDMLPREIDYQEKYGISRITVRSAMSELQSLGYIEKIKGKGTFVRRTKISEPLLKIDGTSPQMKAKGLIPKVEEANISIIGADKSLAKIFNIPLNTPLYKLDRIRFLNDVKIGYFTSYLRSDYTLSLDSSIYNTMLLYPYLEKTHNIIVNRVEQSLSATLADKDIAKRLNCDVNEAILVLKRRAYISDFQTPYEYTIARYIGSKYEYYLELER